MYETTTDKISGNANKNEDQQTQSVTVKTLMASMQCNWALVDCEVRTRGIKGDTEERDKLVFIWEPPKRGAVTVWCWSADRRAVRSPTLLRERTDGRHMLQMDSGGLDPGGHKSRGRSSRR